MKQFWIKLTTQFPLKYQLVPYNPMKQAFLVLHVPLSFLVLHVPLPFKFSFARTELCKVKAVRCEQRAVWC